MQTLNGQVLVFKRDAMGTARWLPVDGLVLGVSRDDERTIGFENHEAVTGSEV